MNTTLRRKPRIRGRNRPRSPRLSEQSARRVPWIEGIERARRTLLCQLAEPQHVTVNARNEKKWGGFSLRKLDRTAPECGFLLVAQESRQPADRGMNSQRCRRHASSALNLEPSEHLDCKERVSPDREVILDAMD